MVQTCCKCLRANPSEAVFCYFDGLMLGGGPTRRGTHAPLAVGALSFASPFVFPSGRSCRSFNELALACQEEWAAARDLLARGYLENFLGGLGRVDLSLAAREAARFPDPDRALDQLLGKLPSETLEEPLLRVEPKEVNLGFLSPGSNPAFELRLDNSGMRLLYGSINSGEAWLTLGNPPGAEKRFQFTHEQILSVHVRRDRMRAGSKPLEGKLLIESNAGSAVVLVRAEVPVQPFPTGVLAGARSPRQVAEKAKANPKEAAALFENGAVAEWYKANGWTYPVQGPTASGRGAVQQFFEALGLTRPPKVQISERSLTLQGSPGDTLRHTVEVKSEEQRHVYAHGVSNQPWLEVRRARLNGRTATLEITVPAVPNCPGETLTARLAVQSNGNQRFVVPVTLEVGGQFDFTALTAAPPPPAVTPPPMPAVPVEPASAPTPPPLPIAPSPRDGLPRWVHLAPAGLLALVLVGVMVWDVVRPAASTAPGDGEAIADNGGPGVAYDVQGEPILTFDYDRRFNPREINYRFGLVLLKEKDPQNDNARKKLTFRDKGASNNTCVRVDGHDFQYGKTPGERAARPVEDKDHHAWQTSWIFREAGIRVAQMVQIVPGAQSGLLDTCLIHYTVENKSNVPHKVGLRVLLDTYIGANDGVPFAIPGRGGVLTKPEVFEKDKIPDYIQALERPDLKEPGTVAHLGLKGIEIPKVHLEPISKLVICPWYDTPAWDIPIEDEAKGQPIKDSCVVLYWPERDMQAGEIREMAFTYGLNAISAPEGSGNLALTAGGSFVVGNDFTVTAYVKDPQPGQKVRLILPDGLSFVSGHEAEQAVEGKGEYSQVSWRVHSDKTGTHLLRAVSGNAGVQHKVAIRNSSLFR